MDHPAKTASQPHQLILQDRRRLELTGVVDVGGFDETAVMVKTDLGILKIAGCDLRVSRLDVEGGSLSLEGEVTSLVYTQQAARGFRRLLR